MAQLVSTCASSCCMSCDSDGDAACATPSPGRPLKIARSHSFKLTAFKCEARATLVRQKPIGMWVAKLNRAHLEGCRDALALGGDGLHLPQDGLARAQ